MREWGQKIAVGFEHAAFVASRAGISQSIREFQKYQNLRSAERMEVPVCAGMTLP